VGQGSHETDDDEGWADVSIEDSVVRFVDKHFIYIICLGILLVSTSLFVWQSIVPTEEYAAWGTLQGFDSTGVDVNITALGFGAFAHAHIGDSVHANPGICSAGDFASRCQLGSNVLLKFVKNRLGQQFWYVDALVIGMPRAVVNDER
jgi:hypothetical protein